MPGQRNLLLRVEEVRISSDHRVQITGRLYADAQFPTSATERTVILTSGVGWASSTPGQPYNLVITSATSGVISTTFNFEPGIGTQTAKIEVWRAGEADYTDTGLRVPSSTTYTGIFELTGIPTSGLTQIRITQINSAGVEGTPATATWNPAPDILETQVFDWSNDIIQGQGIDWLQAEVFR